MNQASALPATEGFGHLRGGTLPMSTTGATALRRAGVRSEEHTSELQSQSNLACRLLLEKKKNRWIPRVHKAILAKTRVPIPVTLGVQRRDSHLVCAADRVPRRPLQQSIIGVPTECADAA